MARYVLVAALLSAAGVLAVIAITQVRGSRPIQQGTASKVAEADNINVAPVRADQPSRPINQDRATTGKLKPIQIERLSADYTAAHKVVVQIREDLKPVQIQIRRPRIINPPYEIEGRLVDQYENLAAAAKGGDGSAARMLYSELLTCDRIAHPRRQDSQYGESDETLLRCEGLTDKHFNNFNEWARIASERGDYLGRQYWAGELGNTQEAVHVLMEYWEDGNASALPALSNRYRLGVASGEPDWISAYAFSLVYFKVSEAAHARNPSGRGMKTRVALGEHVNSLAARLNPSQQAQGEAMAHALLVQNSKCCVGSF
jgi:hypothetical protein